PPETGTLAGANGLPASVPPPAATIPSFGTANTCFHPASPAQGCCTSDPQCADSDPCTSGESCNLATFACSATVVPNCCDANSDCTDNNSCTTDICSPSDSGAISFNGSRQPISVGRGSTPTNLAP